MCGISAQSFLREKMMTSTRGVQRFGPGFYFSLASSKSHEYPLGTLDKSGNFAVKSMLLCKVARGRPLVLTKSRWSDETPDLPGYHSIEGRPVQVAI